MIEAQPITPAPTDPSADRRPACAWHPTETDAEATERSLQMLARLAEMGMNVAGTVEQQALAQAAPQDVGDGDITPPARRDFSLSMARAARCVRMTLAMDARMRADRRALEAGLEVQRAERKAREGRSPEDDEAGRRLKARKREILRVVQEAVEAEALDEEEVADQMDDADSVLRLYAIDDQPFGAVVAFICDQLDLDPDWRRWAETEWALEEARTNAAGSPYADGAAVEGGEDEDVSSIRETGPPSGPSP